MILHRSRGANTVLVMKLARVAVESSYTRSRL
jgi:hypothetical protein